MLRSCSWKRLRMWCTSMRRWKRSLFSAIISRLPISKPERKPNRALSDTLSHSLPLAAGDVCGPTVADDEGQNRTAHVAIMACGWEEWGNCDFQQTWSKSDFQQMNLVSDELGFSKFFGEMWEKQRFVVDSKEASPNGREIKKISTYSNNNGTCHTNNNHSFSVHCSAN